jgi:hypothetical protein
LSVIVGSISSLSFVQLFTILLLKPNRMYNIYTASVSPGSVQFRNSSGKLSCYNVSAYRVEVTSFNSTVIASLAVTVL